MHKSDFGATRMGHGVRLVTPADVVVGASILVVPRETRATDDYFQIGEWLTVAGCGTPEDIHIPLQWWSDGQPGEIEPVSLDWLYSGGSNGMYYVPLTRPRLADFIRLFGLTGESAELFARLHCMETVPAVAYRWDQLMFDLSGNAQVFDLYSPPQRPVEYAVLESSGQLRIQLGLRGSMHLVFDQWRIGHPANALELVVTGENLPDGYYLSMVVEPSMPLLRHDRADVGQIGDLLI